ncbi:MAG: formate transporter FocA [Alphaproteobacteria bacterium]|nr:formate transporter FocA [Alphaproteobacteria bacterium]
MAEKAEQIGAAKTRLPVLRLLTLAVLAGAFIAFGALFSMIAVAGNAGNLPFGVVRILAGLTFSLGLILVVVGGAELFTGNNLMVIAWAGGKISLFDMLCAWGVVYLGNFIGAAATAIMVFLAGIHGNGDAAVGAAALSIAEAKAQLGFFPALMRGVLGNVLVCLAVWLCYSARTTTGKILCIVPPVTGFVAAGFEHGVANMFILPYAVLIKFGATAAFWSAIGQSPGSFDTLGWAGLLTNLVSVTIGNVIGGGVLVGAVYWFVYLRTPGSQIR